MQLARAFSQGTYGVDEHDSLGAKALLFLEVFESLGLDGHLFLGFVDLSAQLGLTTRLGDSSVTVLQVRVVRIVTHRAIVIAKSIGKVLDAEDVVEREDTFVGLLAYDLTVNNTLVRQTVGI